MPTQASPPAPILSGLRSGPGIGQSFQTPSPLPTPSPVPTPGDMVRLRTRTYLVEGVEAEPGGHRVRGACLDDDAQGQPIEVIWELELDTAVLNREVWKRLGWREEKPAFDPPRFFSAYLHSLRWNCITATDHRLFQAPFRAGIRIDSYQLEPLRKALRLPRVNLFIADDVGLGKTIEAGLIATELLLRRRIREIVVACPPSMVPQWKDELETRFGLTFEVLDRDYVEKVRRERGFGVNPWTTFPRFLISQRLLIDDTYAGPLRDWLDNLRPGTLLILDEAHHAAPSSGVRFAIDSKITRAIRDIAPRFEHRLFLSATPHNGHSNSFSALLEILDSQRFCRGIKASRHNLDEVMVRRLKEDIREIAGGFPRRRPIQVDITGLPEEAPELLLSRLLDRYRRARQARLANATKRKQAEAGLLMSGLQQRLLSSIEAFARTLAVHRLTMDRLWAKEGGISVPDHPGRLARVGQAPGPDDDTADLSEEDLHALDEKQFERATAATAGDHDRADVKAEKDLLEQMASIAGQHRSTPDARVKKLIEWLKKHLCPGIHVPGEKMAGTDGKWSGLRVLIFTEYEDTRRYLVNQLKSAIAGTDQEGSRIEVFHGPTPADRREEIKRAFNAPPDRHPVRILVATDAAREGLNLQAHCHNLFHFDVPWNPARLEQRNGRIDRKLQPAPEVFCHYFVYHQRPEDRVLKTLVLKTKKIREELGSLSDVLDRRLEETLRQGIHHDKVDDLVKGIEGLDLDVEQQTASREELEALRKRRLDLEKELKVIDQDLAQSKKWICLDPDTLRDALCTACDLLTPSGTACGAATPAGSTACDLLTPLGSAPEGGPTRYVFPDLENRPGGDSTWAGTLETLRALPEDGKKGFQWRKNSPLRPVVFQAPVGVDDSVVQLHLQHRVVQRLLGRFLSQGFVHHDLSRACLALGPDSTPMVVLLGRLSVYGKGACRLHEELLYVTARWTPPEKGRQLEILEKDNEEKTLELIETALKPDARERVPGDMENILLGALPRDVEDLLPLLLRRGKKALTEASRELSKRGEAEAKSMVKILEEQKSKIFNSLAESQGRSGLQLRFDWNDEEKRQFAANQKYWTKWLESVGQDLETEPARVRDFYLVTSHRVEPVGLVYLVPGKPGATTDTGSRGRERGQ